MQASRAILVLLGAGLQLSCGGDPPPVPRVATPAEVKNFYGLNAGSCWVYRDTLGAQMTASVDGPDTVRIAGKSVYVLTQATAAAPGQPNEILLDVDSTPGKVFLARYTTGIGMMRTTETYLMDPRPLWAEFAFEMDMMKLAPTNRMQSAATPQNATAAIAHDWTVASREQMVAKDDGTTVAAIRLIYSKDGIVQATYDLVPNYGMAHLTLLDKEYQVCRAKVCDAAGVCTGADSCAAPCS